MNAIQPSMALVRDLPEGMGYVKGAIAEKYVGDDGAIELLSWNVLGLPNEDEVLPIEARIDGMARTIIEANAHLVALQECFDPKLSNGLYDRIKGHYAHFLLDIASDTPLTSGLALFSKVPIAQLRFTPHRLLDDEKESRMGTLDFLVLNELGQAIAHLAVSHFQGSSSCQWRKGQLGDGERLSYGELREEQARTMLNLVKDSTLPGYICGDLNVDWRGGEEYDHSFLNREVNSSIQNSMLEELTKEEKRLAVRPALGTNTNFFRHQRGLQDKYKTLSQEQIASLASKYEEKQGQLIDCLSGEPWTRPLSTFDPDWFIELKATVAPANEEDHRLWDYFQQRATKALKREKKLWKKNDNQGEAPNVSVAEVIQYRALPIEESLDYILAVGSQSKVANMVLLKGYDHRSLETTLSDHHPLRATVYALPTKEPPSTFSLGMAEDG